MIQHSLSQCAVEEAIVDDENKVNPMLRLRLSPQKTFYSKEMSLHANFGLPLKSITLRTDHIIQWRVHGVYMFEPPVPQDGNSRHQDVTS